MNAGAQQLEFITVGLDSGTSGEQFLETLGAFFEGTLTEPLPGQSLGRVQAIDPGLRGFFEIDFTPGNYLIFVRSMIRQPTPPNFALGMLQEFTVQ